MLISEKLKKLQLIKGEKISNIFDELYSDILTIKYNSASNLAHNLWERYTPINPSLNGAVFEGILATIFYRSGILPLFVQAKMAFVPNVEFDFIAYTKEYGPIVLSVKTSLRERYKQADLEGMMLRQVHRKSKSYLITLNKQEASSVNRKIKNGQVLGLNIVIVATESKFDHLISELKLLTYYKPEKINIITGSRLVSVRELNV